MAYIGIRDRVIKILETIYDPEIGVDVWNLGLVYSIDVVDKDYVRIKMTLTTPFCPLANILPFLVKERVEKELGVKADIEMVFEPPWSPERITEKGRRMLIEKFGYDVVESWIKMYKRD